MRRTVKAVGIAGKRNRLDQVFAKQGARYMTARDLIRIHNPYALPLAEKEAHFLDVEADAEEKKRPQQYLKIKDGCRECLQPVKPGEREVVEAMRAKQASPITKPDDPELAYLKGRVNQMELQLAELRAKYVELWQQHQNLRGVVWQKLFGTEVLP